MTSNDIVFIFVFSMFIGILVIGMFLFPNSQGRRKPIMSLLDLLFWIAVIYLILAAIFGWPPFQNWPM